MPPLAGFTDNPFQTRPDLVRAAIALLAPLNQYKSKEKARIKLPVATAAGFDDIAAQLEGFARPLWVVPFLLDEQTKHEANLDSWIQGLEAGTDPESPEYWGNLGDCDQRMVEMESIAVALLAAPDAFWGSASETAKGNIRSWLSQINEHEMPKNNWLWFRVFVNLALAKSLGVARKDIEDQIQADLKTLDSFQIGDGWSSDGLWGDERKQADYYSGSFAIQFAQLLYVRFAGEDEARAERYRQSAREFGATFWRYFDTDGAAIPFGRSMTYRFAFAAFWSAAACAGVQLAAPLEDIGVLKGLIFRHLRWWSRHPDIFNVDGTLNIGFTYPNMYMSEGYNSPQSVYWCLKAFIVLMLPETHEFWAATELPHPMNSPQYGLRPSSGIQVVWPPRHILSSTPEHHFLLSSGQMTRKTHKAREAKYGKFAYSSAFGFSVPSGPILEQIAPDSTLCVTHDGGETWKVRCEPANEAIVDVRISGHPGVNSVPALSSVWRPWRYLDVGITTILIPVMEVYPGWHVRIHHVKRDGREKRACLPIDSIRLIDGGFALDATTDKGGLISRVESMSTSTSMEDGWSIDPTTCLLRSRAGSCGVVDLTSQTEILGHVTMDPQGKSFVLRADPNTNLVASRTIIPCVRHEIPSVDPEREQDGSCCERGVWLVTGVFAVAARAGLSRDTVHNMWLKRPSVFITEGRGDLGIKIE
ncbi:hypothetical protein BJX99DRAFT_266581 [Aspergillus californicus]